MELIWVASEADLLKFLPQWRGADAIALDTEFVRERTYFPIPGLVQICDENACYLVDPLAVGSLEPLVDLLNDRKVLKLMHACSEDLELFDTRLGVVPAPIFDTQVAAAFVGQGLSVGYQRLVEDSLGVSLDKSQTRTDWLARPLSAAQLKYAAEDVAYLPAVYRGLLSQLQRENKLAWVEAECDSILRRREPALRREQYRQIGGAWRLEAQQLAVLRDMYAWREQLAGRRDLPRNWLAPDRSLLELATNLPLDPAALNEIETIPAGTRKRYGAEILAQVKASLELEALTWPEPVPAPLSAAQSRQVKRLRAVIRDVAEQARIAPELLGRKRDIEGLLQAAMAGAPLEDLPTMQGWRGELVGPQLQTLLADFCA